MANLQIKDLPDDLHDELRRRAKLAGTTVRAYVQQLIEADQALPPRGEWMRRIHRRRPVRLDRPVADWVADDRAARDGDATDHGER